MSLNPIKWIAWLINEHGSSTVLRERLGQAKDQIAILERDNTTLKNQVADLTARFEKAQIEIDHLKKPSGAFTSIDEMHAGIPRDEMTYD